MLTRSPDLRKNPGEGAGYSRINTVGAYLTQPLRGNLSGKRVFDNTTPGFTAAGDASQSVEPIREDSELIKESSTQ